ncbi:MAG: SLC13 family permease [Bacteroidia bacterium]
MEIALVIGLLFLAIILFSIEKFPVDVITIGLLIILILSGILTPEEAFKGFSSDFMVILASIFILTGALSETGVLDKVGAWLVKVISKNLTLYTAYIMLTTSFISAFMNNTTVTALVIGPVMGMSRKLKIAPSKVLMSVAFASILGGTCTLIGTSTNVAVSSYLAKAGMKPLEFFEILPVGVVLCVVGLIYMLTIGKRLLPEHKETSLTEEYQIRQYLSEIYVKKNSKIIGQRAFQSDLSKKDVKIIKIIRNDEGFIPNRSTTIQAEDLLLVECKLDDLMRIKENSGVEIRADMITDRDIQTDKIKLAEVLITPQSKLINQTLKESKFRLNTELIVLAVHRFDENLTSKIGEIRIRNGDLLLVQGTKENISAVRYSPDFTVLGDFRLNMFKERKGLLTALFFLGAVVVSSFELAPLSVCFLTASLMSVFIGAISTDRIYQLIDFRLLILIGGMSAFGTAMTNTGASVLLAQKINQVFGHFGPMAVLSAYVVLVVFLTQPMSNAAAALVVLPVALDAAHILNANPRTFAIAIMLSASISFITPMEPSCILVYGPGKYRFSDFIKIGLPLTIILIAIIVYMVPKYWPM